MDPDLPPPPPRPESAPPPEPEPRPAQVEIQAARDRFRSQVGLVIAAVSIFGAVVAWRASIVSSNASDLDQRATQELAHQEQLLATHRGQVSQDLRLLAMYQEHGKRRHLMLEQANSIENSNAELAYGLRIRAQGEGAITRMLQGLFLGYYATLDEDGNAEYNRDTAFEFLVGRDGELASLRPNQLADEAGAAQREGENLTGIAAILVTALFFLTIAQVARPQIRRIFAGTGIVVAAVGFILFVLLAVT